MTLISKKEEITITEQTLHRFKNVFDIYDDEFFFTEIALELLERMNASKVQKFFMKALENGEKKIVLKKVNIGKSEGEREFELLQKFSAFLNREYNVKIGEKELYEFMGRRLAKQE